MNLPAGLPITLEDWEKTPPSVQTPVIMLWEENQILKAQVSRLQSQVEALQVDVKRLNERLDKNSQNSSKPPSSDRPQKPKYPKAELSGEKKGGRNGHYGHGRKLKPPDQIGRIVKSVPSMCKDCGTALKGEDARPELHQVSELPKTVPEDETGWFEMAKDFWLWVCTTPDVSVFRIFDSRSGSGAKTLLGENYSGLVGTDRFSGYAWMDPCHRQICWAHLKRDFQALVERGDESKIVGQMLLSRLKTFFGFWHSFREVTLSRLDLQTVMRPIREEIHNLLEIGTLLGHKETRRTCQNILKVKQAL